MLWENAALLSSTGITTSAVSVADVLPNRWRALARENALQSACAYSLLYPPLHAVHGIGAGVPDTRYNHKESLSGACTRLTEALRTGNAETVGD